MKKKKSCEILPSEFEQEAKKMMKSIINVIKVKHKNECKLNVVYASMYNQFKRRKKATTFM